MQQQAFERAAARLAEHLDQDQYDAFDRFASQQIEMMRAYSTMMNDDTAE